MLAPSVRSADQRPARAARSTAVPDGIRGTFHAGQIATFPRFPSGIAKMIGPRKTGRFEPMFMRVPEGVNRFLIGQHHPKSRRATGRFCAFLEAFVTDVDSRRKSVTEEIVFPRTVTGRFRSLRGSSILGLWSRVGIPPSRVASRTRGHPTPVTSRRRAPDALECPALRPEGDYRGRT